MTNIKGINWNQVYYFSVVANYGSIKKASDVLQLSPSTLSEHISQLEKDLKVELFYRHGPKITLTEQGARLASHARGMFEHGERLFDVVSPVKLGRYPISVAFVPGPHLPVAYKWVTRFTEKYGPLDMKLHHSQPDQFERDLLKGKYNFGFIDRLPEHSELNYVLVEKSAIRFYVSMDWQDKKISEVLEAIPLLVCRSEASTEAFIEKALADQDLTPSSVITSDFPSVLIDLCRQGLGVGAFCEEPVQKMNSQMIKSFRTPKGAPQIESKLYAVWAGNSENTAAVSHFKELIGQGQGRQLNKYKPDAAANC
jgi:DNA-binding transcriptional LysR family regulator